MYSLGMYMGTREMHNMLFYPHTELLQGDGKGGDLHQVRQLHVVQYMNVQGSRREILDFIVVNKLLCKIPQNTWFSSLESRSTHTHCC